MGTANWLAAAGWGSLLFASLLFAAPAAGLTEGPTKESSRTAGPIYRLGTISDVPNYKRHSSFWCHGHTYRATTVCSAVALTGTLHYWGSHGFPEFLSWPEVDLAWAFHLRFNAEDFCGLDAAIPLTETENFIFSEFGHQVELERTRYSDAQLWELFAALVAEIDAGRPAIIFVYAPHPFLHGHNGVHAVAAVGYVMFPDPLIIVRNNFEDFYEQYDSCSLSAFATGPVLEIVTARPVSH